MADKAVAEALDRRYRSGWNNFSSVPKAVGQLADDIPALLKRPTFVFKEWLTLTHAIRTSIANMF